MPAVPFTKHPLLTWLGVALLVVPPVAWWLSRPASDVGVVPSSAMTSESPSDDTPSAEEPTEGAVAAPLVGRRSGLLSQQPQQAPARLLELTISSLSVSAPIVEVGIQGDGIMEVPADVSTVGWYRYGPRPGEPGAAVIAGHVDSRTQGRGVFFDLERLQIGDRIDVETEDGTSVWEVVARRQYDKTAIPLDDLFTRVGPPQLILITCGGEFDSSARSYLDNVVVYAEPVEPAPS